MMRLWQRPRAIASLLLGLFVVGLLAVPLGRLSAAAFPAPLLTRKKRGFAVNVVDEWFQSATSSRLSELLLDGNSMMFDLLDPRPVRTLLEEHRSGRNDHHKLLFSLAMFEQWLRGVRSDRRRQPSLAAVVR